MSENNAGVYIMAELKNERMRGGTYDDTDYMVFLLKCKKIVVCYCREIRISENKIQILSTNPVVREGGPYYYIGGRQFDHTAQWCPCLLQISYWHIALLVLFSFSFISALAKARLAVVSLGVPRVFGQLRGFSEAT